MERIKALALFSGGLDSALAIKVIQEQNIEVIALNFVSYFFGGNSEKAENMAKQLGVELKYVDFKKRHLQMMQHPIYGRGKNMNPCIDCHALMFKIAGELLSEYDAKFIISGEVLGQRPMSQNYQALEKVAKLSGMEDLIVRPLCGKLIPPTKPMDEGLVDIEKLLDISGRTRTRQLELVKKYDLKDYETPGGGCLLTDPAYSVRLKALEDDGLMEEKYSYLFYLLNKTRVLRLAKGKYLFVGRDDETNKIITSFIDKGDIQIHAIDTPGPRILLFGDITEEDIDLSGQIFSRYSKVKGKEKISVKLMKYSEIDNKMLIDKVIDVEPILQGSLDNIIKKYQLII